MPILTALYDACVLYPAPLRDLLVSLGGTGLFRARWTDAIHDEWMESLLRERPDLKRDALERTRGLMNKAVPDCLVTGFEPLIRSVTLPHENDRHVVAAAIRCRADIIITRNLRHFPELELAKHGIEAKHPDEFVSSLLGESPAVICETLREMRSRLINPPRSVDEFLGSLERQGLVSTVALLGKIDREI